MPTILVGGYYGAGNIGDEAILASMVGELRARRSDLSFCVSSWGPEKTSRDLQVNAFRYNDIDALLKAASSADLILLGGGGIFHDYWGFDPDLYLRRGYWDLSFFGSFPLLAKLLDIPCMIYAVGVGPLRTDLARRHTRLAFERCQIATLRDDESLELLRQTGFDPGAPGGPAVKVLPDPVFSLATSADDDRQAADFLRRQGVEGDTPLLGVSLRYWDLEKPLEEWLPFIARGVREFLEKETQAQAVLIPFQVTLATPHTDDSAVLKKLADMLEMPDRVHWIGEGLAPRGAQALIKRCTAVVGMRLHSVVMAVNAGTPVVALSYAPKVRSAMRRAGLEAFCIESLTPDSGFLAGRIQSAWDQRAAFRRNIQPLQEELRTQTLEHTRLALELLTGSRRKPLQASQEFALQQVRLLLQADEKLSSLEWEIKNTRAQLEEQQAARAALEQSIRSGQARLAELQARSDQLGRVESSRIWKLAGVYYRLRDETPIKYAYRFLVAWKKEGLGRALGITKRKESEVQSASAAEAGGKQARNPKSETGSAPDSSEAAKNVVERLNAGPLKGVVLVAGWNDFSGGGEIDPADAAAMSGWGVVFADRPREGTESPPLIGKETHPNIYHISEQMLMENPDIPAGVRCPRKFLILESPRPDFFPWMLKLRRDGYRIVYVIRRDWEECRTAGRAGWYDTSFEEAIVVNANYPAAASRPLADKFRRLRADIIPLPEHHAAEGSAWERWSSEIVKILGRDPWMSL